MQDTFLQVFFIALGLLMYPKSDQSVDDGDDAIFTAEMEEHERKLLTEEEKLYQEMTASDYQRLREEKKTAAIVYSQTSLENEKPQEQLDTSDLPPKNCIIETKTWPNQENLKVLSSLKSEKQDNTSETSDVNKDYTWIIWKTFSIISFIHFIWKYSQGNSNLKSNGTRMMLRENAAEYLGELDSSTLQTFYSQYLQSESIGKQRDEEFLDGFVKDLLESVQNVCGEVGGVTIGTADLKNLRNVVVPLIPPESYIFNCVYSNKADDVLFDLQTCGRIKLMKNAQTQKCCSCQDSEAADDVVCLLHRERDEIKTRKTVDFEEHLCQKGSKYLSKARVGQWFRSTLRQAWSLIAFKYEFEVCIDNGHIPGAVIVRFRSGEKIHFILSPVIVDSHSYFFITCAPKNLDTSWCLSLSEYEDTFLDHISKVLPDDSCHMQTLEITLFLHKKQTTLTGSSALKDLHFKNALMHLLLTKSPCEWKPSFLANRLQDLLNFMMSSLKKKRLLHVLIGNPRATGNVQLPADLVKWNPVNLFHPLVVHRCIYQNTVIHFVELLKNAQILVNDYLGKKSRKPSEPDTGLPDLSYRCAL